MTDRSIIGQRIAELRKEKGLTQAELADRLGVTHQAVSQWERSETLPDILTLPKLAEIFGESVNSIMGVEEPAPAPTPEEEALKQSVAEKIAALNAELSLRAESEVPAEDGDDEEDEEEEDLEDGEEEDFDDEDEEDEEDEDGTAEAASDEKDDGFYRFEIPAINIPAVPELHIPLINIPAKQISIPKLNLPTGGEVESQLRAGAEQLKKESERIKKQIEEGIERGRAQFDKAFGDAQTDNSRADVNIEGDFSLPRSRYVYDFENDGDDYEVAIIKDGEIVTSFIGNPDEYLKIELNNLGGSLTSALSVVVNGSVNGDVEAGTAVSVGENLAGDADAGTSVTVGGDVAGDVDAGTCVTVGGEVSGSVDAGSSVAVAGSVDGDIDAGGRVEIGGNVEGAVDTGASADIKGSVNGDVDAGSRVEIGGNVEGDVDAGGNVTIGGDVNGEVSGNKVVINGSLNR